MASTLHPPCPMTAPQCPCHPAINTGLRPSWPDGPGALQYRSALTPLPLHVIGTQRETWHKLDLEREVEGWMDGGREKEKRGDIQKEDWAVSKVIEWAQWVEQMLYYSVFCSVAIVCRIYTGKHQFQPIMSSLPTAIFSSELGTMSRKSGLDIFQSCSFTHAAWWRILTYWKWRTESFAVPCICPTISASALTDRGLSS